MRSHESQKGRVTEGIAHLAGAVAVHEPLGRLGAPGHGVDRVHGVDGGHDLGLADHRLRLPLPVGVERHPLDEPHGHAPVALELREVDDLVVVDPA